MVVSRLEAGRVTHRTGDVDRGATAPTDQVVVVVIHPVLVTSQRARRLDPSDEPLVGQDAECVVDRLARHGTDLGPDQFLDLVGCAMRPFGHCSKGGQALSRDLHTASAQKVSRLRSHSIGHNSSINPILDCVKNQMDPAFHLDQA
jgi:hypothetical protein